MSTDACFEGFVENPTKAGNPKHWCTFDGEALSFYRNKRSSCMYRIEVVHIVNIERPGTKQFVITTKEKKHTYAVESEGVCSEWVKQIELTIEKNKLHKEEHCTLDESLSGGEEHAVNLRRESRPNPDTVHKAIQRLSADKDKPQNDRDTSTAHQSTELRLRERGRGSTREIISKFTRLSRESKTETNVHQSSSPSKNKVNLLLQRFSGEEQVTSPEKSPKISPRATKHKDNLPLYDTMDGSVAESTSDGSRTDARNITVINIDAKQDLPSIHQTFVAHNDIDNENRDSGYSVTPLDTSEDSGEGNTELKIVVTPEPVSPVQMRRKRSTVETEFDIPSFLNKEESEEEEENDDDETPDLEPLEKLNNLTLHGVNDLPHGSLEPDPSVLELQSLLCDETSFIRRSLHEDINDHGVVDSLRDYLHTLE